MHAPVASLAKRAQKLPKEGKRCLREFTFDDFKLDYPIMVCPFIRKYEDEGDFYSHTKCLEFNVDDSVIDYVYKHRKNTCVTKEEISAAYARLKEEYAPALERMVVK